ncbi:MAG: DUF4907 domain-containing protein [Chitinophagales bacterium]|nr:DUF4907 domain-containing protein [Chitinophagales bacterium]
MKTLLFCLLLLFAATLPAQTATDSLRVSADAELSWMLIQAPENTYGYMILMDGNLLIWQENQPGKPGTLGFKYKENAARVAEFIISKLRRNELPPSVKEEDWPLLNLKPETGL